MSDQDLDIRDSELGTAFECLSEFTCATESQRILMTLWAAHTHAYRQFPATPRLAFLADGPGTGKSVNMQLAVSMSANPLLVGYASQASMYSWLDEHPDTTMGLDEIDKVFGADGRKTNRAILAAVVNDGYSSEGNVMVNRGSKAVQMPIFCPVATAGIGRLPADTMTRAIPIKLTRGTPQDQFVPEVHKPAMRMLADSFASWLGNSYAHKRLTEYPTLADVPGDSRWRLILSPLGSIATLAGIHERFLEAVTEIQTGLVTDPPMTRSQIFLEAVRDNWPASEDMLTGEQIRGLLPNEVPDGRMGDIMVAGWLREQGIETVASGGRRGYRQADVFASVPVM